MPSYTKWPLLKGVCVCVCVCVWERERESEWLLCLLTSLQPTNWLELKAMLPLRSLVYITIGIGYQVCVCVCVCYWHVGYTCTVVTAGVWRCFISRCSVLHFLNTKWGQVPHVLWQTLMWVWCCLLGYCEGGGCGASGCGVSGCGDDDLFTCSCCFRCSAVITEKCWSGPVFSDEHKVCCVFPIHVWSCVIICVYVT